MDLLHILVHQAVKDEADRKEGERIKAIEAIQAAQLGIQYSILFYKSVT